MLPAYVSKDLRDYLEKQGMTILTGTSVEELEAGIGGARAKLKGPDGTTRDITVDRVILAIGITGNIEGLGLEEIGVQTDRGHIVIDEWCRTGAEGVDLCG